MDKIIRHRIFYYAMWGVGIGILALPYVKIVQAPVVLLMLGRFHPLLIHFPIVLIPILLVMEISRVYLYYHPDPRWVLALLMITLICTLTTLTSGYFLYASGEYAGYLIEQHFWGGVITAFLMIASLLFFVSFWLKSRPYIIYYISLILANIAVVFTGHLGGSVTHGKDYLTGYFPLLFDQSNTEVRSPDSVSMVYDDYIAPILESKCVSCHNDLRAKGGLSLSSYAQLFTKGRSGQYAVAPGMSAYSELVKRVILPVNHDEHMPPAGKTPLTKDEVELIRYWIDLGSSDTLSLSHLEDTSAVLPIIKELEPAIAIYRRSTRMAQIASKALGVELAEIASRLQVVIRQDSMQEGNSYTISMQFPPSPFGLDQLKELRPYFDYFTKVSLVSSDLGDEALYFISQMKNLKELYLQKTKISGQGLIYLQKLPSLEILNISFTAVNDKYAIDLLDFPTLREVFLYRTNTTPQVIQALGKYKPDLKIHSEEGPYF